MLVGSPKDYDQLYLSIRRHFPNIPADHRVSYHIDELAISKGALVEVSEDIWDTGIPLLNTLTVQCEPRALASKSSGKRAIREKEEACDSSCDERYAVFLLPPVEFGLRSRTATISSHQLRNLVRWLRFRLNLLVLVHPPKGKTQI